MNQASDSIRQFHGSYAFLSNFHPCDIEFEGLVYPTVEHAFQAAKVLDTTVRLKFLKLTPAGAKSLGRRVALRSDWEQIKLSLMEMLVTLKFQQHTELQMLLLATAEAELIEGNTWNDRFWGVSLKTGQGRNELGQILMRVRLQLQAQLRAQSA
jgi:ribA/ribD-fused uncharacterized protein